MTKKLRRLQVLGREAAYIFSDPCQLTADFFDEIKRWQHEHSHD